MSPLCLIAATSCFHASAEENLHTATQEVSDKDRRKEKKEFSWLLPEIVCR